MSKNFPELCNLEESIPLAEKHGAVVKECMIQTAHCDLPIYSIRLGSNDSTLPTLAIIGGIHGLERIGTRVVIAHMESLLQQLEWDSALNEMLATCRILFYPIANPGGMFRQTRSNPAGVDLMRHAPIDREKDSYLNLLAGHRISPKLPWFRGYEGETMQPEADALINFCKRELWPSKVSIVLDVHSGFGFRDRLWFPYAKAKRPIKHLAEVYALRKLLRRSHPYHVYKVEPQSRSYTTHGDLWDFIYDKFCQACPDQTMIPLCLEMGSWNWVRKNPRQVLSLQGLFNPTIHHREQRTLRRHTQLFDFLLRAVKSHQFWINLEENHYETLHRRALIKWYTHD